MRVYDRFIKYVQVHTTSSSETGTHPSFIGEFDLAGQLAEELKKLGLSDVRVDEKCYVYGKLPASRGYENKTSLGFVAHMDTAPDASGENVVPVIHENFNGECVEFPKTGFVMTKEKYPALGLMKGETLITSDGTTLLGADDKAGVAEIMTLLEELTKTDNIKHGPISVCFTPDEEIGEGANYFDISGFGAKFAYTVDGGDCDAVEYENFNAAGAKITFRGLSVHPGDAKDTMVNASKLAMEFNDMLPKEECPEKTCEREGFYHLTDIRGSVSEAVSSYIIRDHDRDKFQERKACVENIGKLMNEKYGVGTVSVNMKDSYYNMYEKIKPHMHLVENAKKAISKAGLNPVEIPVRGGTDGARLSYEGLPCPNLGTGGFYFHGNQECISYERMEKAVEILLNIVEIYSELEY